MLICLDVTYKKMLRIKFCIIKKEKNKLRKSHMSRTEAKTDKAEKEDLKVIYMSGYSMELLEPGFRSRNNINFLPKPYHPIELAETIRSCLDT